MSGALFRELESDMEENKIKQMLQLFGEYQAVTGIDIETKRNTDSLDIFEAMIREAYENVVLVVAGHHIMFMCKGSPLPHEIASADTLIFNHFIAKKVWKENQTEVLAKLAVEPTVSRDALLRQLFNGRIK